jgi:TRAP-type C4-dicarboxylate transport system substrate-binding protein
LSLGCLLLTLSPAVSFAAQTFKIATVSPDGTTWMLKMRAAAEEIAARTQDRVAFKFYPGGVMGSDDAVLRKIRIGQLHGGAVTGGTLGSINPDAQAYGLPLLFHSLEEVDYVRARMDADIARSVEKKGFVALGLAEGGFAYVMSSSPIRGTDDLRGRKVWSPPSDDISRALFESAGLAPVVLPLSDVLTGLQTGMIDTVGASPIGAIALQWHTRTRYLTDAPMFYLFGTVIVDRKVFERLSPADQKTVREVFGKALAEIDRQNRLDNVRAREALVRQGIEILSVPPEKFAHWQEVARSARERLARLGLYTPSVLSALQTHLDTFRRQQGRGARQ